MPAIDASDLDLCAQEPIHIIGSTQSYGFLIAVSEPDYVVHYVSENFCEIAAKSVGDVLGRELRESLGDRQSNALRMSLEAGGLAVNQLKLLIGRPARRFSCSAHRNDDMLLLEFEPYAGVHSLEPLDFITDLQNPMKHMESQVCIDGLAEVAAGDFRATSGFDRVMIYRFDSTWNGHVIAEAGGRGQSYLGHYFPATDIPAQARRLFLVNALRSIVDVESPPVPVLSDARDSPSPPLDLSRSVLRSASLVHLQYLRNMGVRATMTVSIVVHGELWGLVAAHHYTPHRLDLMTRSICSFLGQTLASKITSISENTLLQQRLESRERIESFMTSSEHAISPWRGDSFETLPLLALLDVDGVVSAVDGVISTRGSVVAEKQLRPVIEKLRAQSLHGVASSSTLFELEPKAGEYAAQASGALFISLSDASSDYLLFLRREVAQTMVWAGNPNKAAAGATIDNGTTLSPRASFESWREIVRGSSRPWTELELENAGILREHFLNARMQYYLRDGEMRYQQERARSTLFQQAILPPQLPSVSGLSFDAVYESGRRNEQVGGDWYDAVRLIDGRVLVTIGDVAGSGVNAAVIMGVVRQIMRGIAQLHPEPALMLDAADRALRLEYPEAFVTAWVGVFDLVARTLTYASAGHPPPLLLQANGTLRELDHRTLPIGLRQGHQGHASTIAITHGSLLCLYTDGLIEATHNILEGIGRLEETLLALGTESLAHPAAAIRRLVIPDGSSDDVAILVIHTNFDESERYLTRSQFDSTNALSARTARRTFAESLSSQNFSETDIANAEMVFGELCGNVARYAAGVVDVVVDRSGLQTVLHVLDHGSGFRHFSRLPTDVLSESGRGLFIIAAMTSEFTVTQRVDGGSHARAVLVGRYPQSLLRDVTLPAVSDQVSPVF